MPYISTDAVAAKRKAIKAAFPGWKFSITKDSSTIKVAILEAPIKLTEKTYESVNHYYIHDHYEGATKDALLKIHGIMAAGVQVLVEDGDYGTVPTFYTSITIGMWDKPFVYKS